MGYSTIADVRIAVGGASRLDAMLDHDANGVADAGVIDAGITEADALINSYASKRFAVPFVPVPATIVALSARLTARILRRNRAMTLVADVEDEKTDRKWLEALATGAVVPGIEPLPEKSELVVDTVGERDSTRTTTRERMKGFW